MEISTISERENPLLSRKELWIRIKANKTPTVKEVREKVAAALGMDEKLVIVDHIRTEYGTPDAIAYVKVYADENVMMRVEREARLRKNEVIGGGEEGSQQEVGEVQA